MPSRWFLLFIAVVLLLSACQPQGAPVVLQAQAAAQQSEAGTAQAENPANQPLPSPFPTRPLYEPGELVDYTAQTGDTLPNLAKRFNTTIKEILEANSFIPPSATTMPPGMPMKIPIYYLPLWGSPYKILPDSLFIDGPAQVGFDTQAFVTGQPGWLNGYTEYAADATRSGAQIIDYVALRYSVSPRLLLALLEYQAEALTNPTLPDSLKDYVLGHPAWEYKGLYMQLNWAANLLNNGYYSFRQSKLLSLEYPDGRMERFDPWINAATASLHYYYNQLFRGQAYERAISPDGLAHTYQSLFGDPWQSDQPHIPGSLTQPEFILPFELAKVWAYTGGPHTGWGKGEPLAAIDFAPPSMKGGCQPTDQWATAVAAGRVVRSETGVVVLDLDEDGDERTGWDIFYLHIGTDGRAPEGAILKRGDRIGHPSCEGGTSTGTHIHIARKYNGEWIDAEGALAFNLEGWVAYNGREPYLGTLRRETQIVTACVCSNAKSFIESKRR